MRSVTQEPFAIPALSQPWRLNRCDSATSRPARSRSWTSGRAGRTTSSPAFGSPRRGGAEALERTAW